MKITREELLKKAQENHEHPNPRFHPEAANSWEDGVIAGAKTVGFEVLGEQELPERLQPLLRWPNAPAAMVWVRFLLPDGSEPLSEEQVNALAAELALRYNAKAEVLAVAEELMMCPVSARSAAAAQRLRAAYDKEKP